MQPPDVAAMANAAQSASEGRGNIPRSNLEGSSNTGVNHSP
jgi:hypothetical protein